MFSKNDRIAGYDDELQAAIDAENTRQEEHIAVIARSLRRGNLERVAAIEMRFAAVATLVAVHGIMCLNFN